MLINAPAVPDPQFDEQLVVEDLMGKWHVVRSTLPMWKSKKDVTITYKLIEPATDPLSFEDLVQYRSADKPATSALSSIKGVDKQSGAPTRYHWRGSGWLRVATSDWEVIGYGGQWAVTYFQKTMFTPAGLDIYVRTPGAVSDDVLEEIAQQAVAVGGEVGELAKTFFRVAVSAFEPTTS